MEADDKGPDTEPKPDTQNRPRAPPVAKKPNKPLPPKKPLLPAKPLSKKIEVQNGEDSKPLEKQPSEVHEPSQSTVPSSKNPPPPTPPKNSSSATRNRTPPPLPKNPPRGTKSRVPTGKSLDKPTDSVNTSDSSITAGLDHSVNTDQVLVDKTSSIVNENSSQKLSSITALNGDHKAEGPKPLQVGTSVKDSTKTSPKVPLKPKPRPDKKFKDRINDSSSFDAESPTNNVHKPADNEGGAPKSTWYVQDNSENPVTSNSDITSIDQNHIRKTVDTSSPKQSPKVPRKPLPKIPSKSSSPFKGTSDGNKSGSDGVTVVYSKDSGAVINTSKIKAVSDNNDAFPESDNNLVQDNSVQDITSDNSNDKISNAVKTSLTSSGESKPQPFPKPVPRRSIPGGRPIPIPRKRLSINRLSGSEDSFNQDHLMTSSVHNLSVEKDSHSNEKEFLSVKEGMSKSKSEENVFSASHKWDVVTGTIDIDDTNPDDGKGLDNSSNVINRSPGKTASKTTEGTVVNSFVKSRVVFSERGEEKQYRVIDKSVVTTQSVQSESYNKSTSPVLMNGESKIDAKTEPEKPGESRSEKEKKDQSPDNFDDILSDKSILEPSSLLNEIEEILSRSHKHLSLTRSGSSPEKQVSPFLNVKNERSRSVDSCPTGVPVRPPRPRKEQKRVRAQSQVMYDSCESETESLPDTSHTADDNLTLDERSMTLGRAKPHPPKPKRHKLLKVQRSQSDVTAMKNFVDKQGHKRQSSDGGPMTLTDQSGPSQGGDVNPQRPKSWRKSRPSKKAPPPPIPPYKLPSTNIDKVVPIVNTGKPKQDGKKSKRGKMGTMDDSVGSVYHSIQDDECNYSSEGEHDYHEIPEDVDKNLHNVNPNSVNKHGQMIKITDDGRDHSGSPPKLPPRNQNNSMSFETSSLSSLGHEFDSNVTGEASSSVEDMSVSGVNRAFPKTSSPNVVVVTVTDDDLENGLGLGASPVCAKQRPPSGVSLQSDSGSGSHVTEHVSSSDSDGDDDKKTTSKRERKLFMIVQEIASTERTFVDVLILLNVDFRKHISDATESHGRPVIPSETLNRILDYLPQLQNFNEDLLKDLENRINKWEEEQGIADIFVKKGPFLKLYSSYIRDFETMTATLDEALKKYPAFQAAVKEFEMSPRCASLALKHYMLKPIQRIPQYRLLLQDYTKHLPEDSVEMGDTQTALAIVSEVAHHANENMRHGDYVTKMLEIQRSLIGQFEVIKPGRTFLKEGELMKLSRKEMQPRFFFLFNDVLLYTTPVATGYRLNNVLPLAGMKVSVSAQDEFKTEFSIISVQRSFTLHSSNLEERDDWVHALNSAIEENAQKRNTFEAVRAGAQGVEVMLDKDFVLGHKAPLWIPDARVTMCMLCTCEFTVTWRRHHCRACGRVVCGNCSDCKAPLRYLKYKPARVCDECFKNLKQDAENQDQEPVEKDDNSTKEPEESSFLSLKNGLLERFQKIRKSGRSEKKGILRPTRLVEVNANDEGASMSGYLNKWQKGKKWKRSWYLVKDKVLYTFKATQDTAAADSMVLLGWEVSRFTEYFEGIEPDLLFQLSHSNTAPIVFRTDSATATEKWVTVMRESSVT